MSRKAPTWFGIKLSKKHATQVFILSLAGVFLLSMIIVPFLFSFISSFLSAIQYGDMDWYFQYTLLYMLPYLVVFITILIVTIYSLVKSRKVAVFYSNTPETSLSEAKAFSFCPNCGNKRTGIEKFCRECGEEFK
ncbi:MAG: zinc ribbon domain-containing protein [Candidatus Odinarchaeota archaeon]